MSPEDPFTEGDPEAFERERRRLQREAQRRARDERRSLGDRVSGALDGAAAKGREVVEHGRERVHPSNPPAAEGAEPPALRRTPAASAPAEPTAPSRRSAADVVPVREGPLAGRRRRAQAERRPRVALGPPTREQAALAEAAIAAAEARRAAAERPPEAPVASAAPAEPPPPSPPAPSPGGPGDPRKPPAVGADAGIWRRRILALVGVLVVAAGAIFAIKHTGGDDPTPAAKGPRTLKTISLTIPEGLARADVAKLAAKAGLKGDYEKATEKAPKSFDLKKAGAPSDASLEGFLFPATYELEKGAPVGDLVGKQLEAFDQNFGGIDMGYAKKKNLSIYDVVTIASMIEREVEAPKERPLVAAVIYNRLADGEPLGIDATLRYEVGFDKPLTESELSSDSPYNTRINPGLPPTPIGNPGLDSLKAAAHPADVNYKYYVFKPGSCNEHTFTADYNKFLQLQAAYQAALEAKGKQPTSC